MKNKMRLIDNFDGFLFDLDGTLVDSMWMWKQIDIDYLSNKNIEMPKDLQKKIEGMSFTETAIYFKETFGIADDIDTIKAEWNDMAKDTYKNKVFLKNGVKDFLTFLKKNNKKIGIATSNSKELTKVCLDSNGIGDIFDAIITGCDITKGKPDPEIYFKTASALNVSPEKCIVFEDIPFGIMAGKNAGMTTCGVYDNYSKDVTDEKVMLADYYVEDISEFYLRYCK